jgi:DNA polymerase
MDRSRSEQLGRIEEELRDLEQSPLYQYRRQQSYSPVVGEGDPSARVMFVGEAPGKREAETGRPFVGNAGQLLTQMLASIGLEREDVYITNVVKDRPPDNRDPTAEEIELYGPFLDRQIEIIQPEVIVPLGRFATEYVLERFDLSEAGRTMGDLHGHVLQAEASYANVVIIPLYHPAAAFYNQKLRDVMVQDFRTLSNYL